MLRRRSVRRPPRCRACPQNPPLTPIPGPTASRPDVLGPPDQAPGSVLQGTRRLQGDSDAQKAQRSHRARHRAPARPPTVVYVGRALVAGSCARAARTDTFVLPDCLIRFDSRAGQAASDRVHQVCPGLPSGAQARARRQELARASAGAHQGCRRRLPRPEVGRPRPRRLVALASVPVTRSPAFQAPLLASLTSAARMFLLFATLLLAFFDSSCCLPEMRPAQF